MAMALRVRVRRSVSSKCLAAGVLVFLIPACSQANDAADLSGQELPFADAAGEAIERNCAAAEAKILSIGGQLEDEDAASLVDIWIAAAPLATRPGNIYLELLEQAAVAEQGDSPKSDVVSVLDGTIEFLREIDDVTYESCGLPVYSAAAAVATTDVPPAEMPCFTHQPDQAAVNDLLYGPVDCATGAGLFLHSDGQWHDEVEPAPVASTTTIPAPTTSRVTRTLPPTTLPQTTQAPQTTVPTSKLGPDGSEIPPVTDENGEVVEPPSTTTTTIASI